MIKKTKPAETAGKIAEDIAAEYLRKQGLDIIKRNFHSRFGEIDLITIDQDILVFVEVRYRKNEHYLAAIETIDQNKCRKLIMTSEYFLSKHNTYKSHQCRYDVITLTGDLNRAVIEWIKNAFQA